MTTPSLTNPNPKREGANQARHLTVNEPTEHANDAIYIHDEDDNDIATFFHSEHATVGQSYETALRLATLLVEANNGALASARPSPGDPVRAALEALVKSVQYIAEDYVPDHPRDNGAALEEMREALFALVEKNSPLSVSTPTGEGEACDWVKLPSEADLAEIIDDCLAVNNPGDGGSWAGAAGAIASSLHSYFESEKEKAR